MSRHIIDILRPGLWALVERYAPAADNGDIDLHFDLNDNMWIRRRWVDGAFNRDDSIQLLSREEIDDNIYKTEFAPRAITALRMMLGGEGK